MVDAASGQAFDFQHSPKPLKASAQVRGFLIPEPLAIHPLRPGLPAGPGGARWPSATAPARSPPD